MYDVIHVFTDVQVERAIKLSTVPPSTDEFEAQKQRERYVYIII